MSTRDDHFSDYYLSLYCESCSHTQTVEIIKPVIGVDINGDPILLDGQTSSRGEYCDSCSSSQLVALGYAYDPDTTVY